MDIRISSVRSGSFFFFYSLLFSNESDETGREKSSINNKQPKPMVDEGIGFEEVCPRTKLLGATLRFLLRAPHLSIFLLSSFLLSS
jgi:hypothetical protein